MLTGYLVRFAEMNMLYLMRLKQGMARPFISIKT